MGEVPCVKKWALKKVKVKLRVKTGGWLDCARRKEGFYGLSKNGQEWSWLNLLWCEVVFGQLSLVTKEINFEVALKKGKQSQSQSPQAKESMSLWCLGLNQGKYECYAEHT